MGLFKLFSDDRASQQSIDNRNPDPYNYQIIQTDISAIGYTLLEVRYPNCTTFEGRKLILIKGKCPSGKLDPHFLEENNVVARFRPDQTGRMLARLLLDTLGP